MLRCPSALTAIPESRRYSQCIHLPPVCSGARFSFSPKPPNFRDGVYISRHRTHTYTYTAVRRTGHLVGTCPVSYASSLSLSPFPRHSQSAVHISLLRSMSILVLVLIPVLSWPSFPFSIFFPMSLPNPSPALPCPALLHFSTSSLTAAVPALFHFLSHSTIYVCLGFSRVHSRGPESTIEHTWHSIHQILSLASLVFFSFWSSRIHHVQVRSHSGDSREGGSRV